MHQSVAVSSVVPLVVAACGSDNKSSNATGSRQRATTGPRQRPAAAHGSGSRPGRAAPGWPSTCRSARHRLAPRSSCSCNGSPRRSSPGTSPPSTRASTKTQASTYRSSRAASTSCRRRCWPTVTPTSPSRGCRRRSPARGRRQHRRHRPDLPALAARLQVSFKDKNITTAEDFKGKKIGNWGFGNEYEIFAALTEGGPRPGQGRHAAAAELRHDRPARRATSTPPRR